MSSNECLDGRGKSKGRLSIFLMWLRPAPEKWQGYEALQSAMHGAVHNTVEVGAFKFRRWRRARHALNPLATNIAFRLRRFSTTKVGLRLTSCLTVVGLVFLVSIGWMLVVGCRKASLNIGDTPTIVAGPLPYETTLANGVNIRILAISNGALRSASVWGPDGNPVSRADLAMLREHSSPLDRYRGVWFEISGPHRGDVRDQVVRDDSLEAIMAIRGVSTRINSFPSFTEPKGSKSLLICFAEAARLPNSGSEVTVALASGRFLDVPLTNLSIGPIECIVKSDLQSFDNPGFNPKPTWSCHVMVLLPENLSRQNLRITAVDKRGREVKENLVNFEDPCVDLSYSRIARRDFQFMCVDLAPSQIALVKIKARNIDRARFRAIHFHPN